MKLNQEQLAAVHTTTGATLVVAGAGCGKTRVITERISHLISACHTAPQRILALTFTNKAAKEMLHRIEQRLGGEVKAWPFVGTFHAYCFLLLRKYANLLGLGNFGVLDATDQTTLVKRILAKYGLEKEFSAREVLSSISSRKNSAHPANFAPITSNERKLAELYQAYEKEKALSNNLDFDDLLLIIFKNLQQNDVFLTTLQSGIDHILIDEYQDTNHVQHGLIKLLSIGRPSSTSGLVSVSDKTLKITSVFAVGDQDQSIYSWRGAIVENMNEFLTSYADAKIIKVQQNYRSPHELLLAANHLIRNNNKRYAKELWSENKSSNCIFVAHCRNEFQEADLIAATILQVKMRRPTSSIAVLYRNHYQSRLVEEALIQNKIQYNIVGGVKFYERKEIKDLLAYLKLIVNPQDWISLLRVLNCPTRGLGEKVLEKLDELLDGGFYSDFRNLLTDLAEKLSLTKQKAGLQEFLAIYLNSPSNLAAINPSSALEYILEKTAYFNFLEKENSPEDAEIRKKNIWELQKSMQVLEAKYDHPITVRTFLEEIALIQDADSNIAQNQDSEIIPVQLMTLHSAKGLEFDFVAIIGLEDGNLPSLRTNDIEEERRLTYVGITRAKSKLLLCYAEYRNEFGRLCSYAVSRFIGEIPHTFICRNQQNLSLARLQSEVLNWLRRN